MHLYTLKEEKGGLMKNLFLLVTTIYLAASTSAYSAQTTNEDCAALAESTKRDAKVIEKNDKKKDDEGKVKSN
jgi:hypothetical protein